MKKVIWFVCKGIVMTFTFALPACIAAIIATFAWPAFILGSVVLFIVAGTHLRDESDLEYHNAISLAIPLIICGVVGLVLDLLLLQNEGLFYRLTH